MKIATRFVKPLKSKEEEELEKLMGEYPTRREWIRAHSIKLSSKGYSVDQIAEIHEVDRDTVTIWLNNWEESGIEGLRDKPILGRPKILNDKEEEIVTEIVKDNPRSIKQIASKVVDQIKKKVSMDTLRGILKEADLVWKRVRKSVKYKRDDAAFYQAQIEIEDLQDNADDGLIDLYYFDGAGFSLDPSIAYAWQPKGEVIELPAAHSKRVNVLGFLNTDNKLESFVFQSPIDSQLVIDCFHIFAKRITKKTTVIIDNAPIQTSDEFVESIEEWQKQGLIIKYLPQYCPELNLIEILWRNIKYRWLPFSAYSSFHSLHHAVVDILHQVGSKYQILFS